MRARSQSGIPDPFAATVMMAPTATTCNPIPSGDVSRSNPDLNLPKLLDSNELADLLRVDERTIRRRVERGEIPLPIEGTHRPRLWSRRVIEDWIEGRTALGLKHGPARR